MVCWMVLFPLLIHSILSQYALPPSAFPAYGVPSGLSSPHSSYDERALLVWLNYIRIDPQYYKSNFLASRVTDSTISNVFATSNLPAKPPIKWNLNLNRVARAHSYDHIVNCPTLNPAHNNCNSTTFGTRINKFYSGGASEIYFKWPFLNSYGGRGRGSLPAWSFWTMATFICDGPLSTGGTMNSCPVDGSAGHRVNIMTYNGEGACGLQFATDYSTVIVTCNQGTSTTTNSVYGNVTLHSGAHIFTPGTNSFSSTSYRFVANYYSSAGVTPSRAQVVFNGSRYDMAVESGENTRGNYVTSQTFPATDTTTSCAPYHFEFMVGGELHRYPAKGELLTTYLGSCANDYSDQDINVPGEASSTQMVSILLLFVFVILFA